MVILIVLKMTPMVNIIRLILVRILFLIILNVVAKVTLVVILLVMSILLNMAIIIVPQVQKNPSSQNNKFVEKQLEVMTKTVVLVLRKLLSSLGDRRKRNLPM